MKNRTPMMLWSWVRSTKSRGQKSWRRTMKDVDDDCVVLDGDPHNKPVDYSAIEIGFGLDELLIVGEKGQIACRDCPHSRHLCVSFPFSTTPHDRHCNQCHYYVCDSLAPCVSWGNGISSTDHCHATDKDETWKIQRRNFKFGKNCNNIICFKNLGYLLT
ncbi:RPM1 interacting protein 13-like [Ziziphus jujuba]|uniref:RPM1 interacting protein 13-like n=2 Tax=Ziziphus jujuba TaxID=326968 RepID=A0ABM3ZSZ7_ZIZJJ|nr:RPM1 interacting protein 13-like [Ziziphus jujuba]KAH7517522.1 hypothetical protein FEM48_Zijuj09G0073700 [Ziziphus jujuba var. spinosa]